MPPLSLLSCPVGLSCWTFSPWYFILCTNSHGITHKAVHWEKRHFSLAFGSFSMPDEKERAGWFASTDIPKLPSQASFVFPLLSQGKRKCEWLERQNEPLKEAEGNSELVTHSCLLLASRKMPLKTERRNHFAESKGIDFPATFSRSFF